jgi:hypothetical protein
MTEAPERIWATGNGTTGSWNDDEVRMKKHMPEGWQTEYVRADLVADQQALRAALKAIMEASEHRDLSACYALAHKALK